MASSWRSREAWVEAEDEGTLYAPAPALPEDFYRKGAAIAVAGGLTNRDFSSGRVGAWAQTSREIELALEEILRGREDEQRRKHALVARVGTIANTPMARLLGQIRTLADLAREPRVALDRIEIADVAYPLKRAMEGVYRAGGFAVGELGPDFEGRGDTLETALEGWKTRVHVAFQRLARKRPFEMSEGEKATWAALESVIDVTAFREGRPLVFPETGRVAATYPNPFEIAWWPSERVEPMSLAALPAEFAAYDAGQWFEAIVERDRNTFEIRKVRHVTPIEPIRPMTEEELDAHWQAMTPTTALPESTDGWGRRP